jgi:hypothetical protein
MSRTFIRWDGTHLPEELKGLPPGTYVVEPDAPPPEWERLVEEALRRGEERFRSEQDRFRAAGLIDADGAPLASGLPPDMRTGSKTDLAT